MKDYNKEILHACSLLDVCFGFLREWETEYLNLPSKTENGLLYHYTSLRNCSKIMISDDLFLFDSRHCNDLNEYKSGQEYVSDFFSGSVLFKKNDFPDNDDPWLRYEYDL